MLKQTMVGLALAISVISSPVILAEGARKAMITPEIYSFTVEHDGEPVEVMRNQNPENKVHELYSTTFRGMPQPIHPFEPHEIETIGERELVAYMQAAQSDENVLIVDTRTEGWHYRLTIPGSVNVPFTVMQETETAEDALDDFGAVKNADGSYDYSQAKTLAMFCNGYWCGQTPTLIRALLDKEYPAEKMKYYRGGMQAWTSLGLTTVGDAE